MPTGKKTQPPKEINWQSLLWLVLIIFVISNTIQFLFYNDHTDEISYSKFKQDLAQGLVSEVVIDGERLTGTYEKTGDSEGRKETQGKNEKNSRKFITVLPPFDDPKLIELLGDEKISVVARPQQNSTLWTVLITLLPWLLIIGFFVYINKKMRQNMGGGGGPLGIGKSKAKLYRKSKEETTFNEVAGLENAKKELQEIIEFLKTPEKFHSLGGELPKGIMLVGPPGIGKTLLAKATAGEAEVPFYSISGSEFIEMFVGVGASRVRNMFKNAKKNAPSIIFIDEIDSIGRIRGSGLGGGHDEREQTLNQILSEMDGFSTDDPVVVIAATNRPDVLDPALVRPGRFDRQISLDLPQKKARFEILKLHTSKIPLAGNIDLEKIAAATVGFSGADLRNLVNEAALLAARKGKKKVDELDFDQGRDKILLGLEREDHLSDKEKRIVAYHESGHALVALLSPNADPLKKVTIIPRGRSLGATEQLPVEDRHNFGRQYLFDRLCIMLGGHAAEKVIYDEATSGAGDDLKKATELARRMICQWGMSERLGPVFFSRGEPHPFLGRELSEEKNFSDETARIIDEEILSLLRQAQKKAQEILGENRQKLDSLAEKLIECESLTDREIDDLLQRDHEQGNENKSMENS
ncbi:MAG: ATP-dependent zinc metalloprotease FtsH [Desulfobulbaceae bacterium]|nr:ATP-dependent zinc metalloprotease FtsH [Desulfobulbaceae bacterium]